MLACLVWSQSCHTFDHFSHDVLEEKFILQSLQGASLFVLCLCSGNAFSCSGDIPNSGKNLSMRLQVNPNPHFSTEFFVYHPAGFIVPILGTCILLSILWTLHMFTALKQKKAKTTLFYELSSRVCILMLVSDDFVSHARRGLRAGYAYMTIPWVDDKQWHPFSLFEDPSDPRIQQMFLIKVGDRTGNVHKALLQGKRYHRS